MDDKGSNILVSYEKRNLLFKLPASLSEFKKESYAKFFLDNSTEIVIQCFNESWCEYIDVTQDEEIIPGCKYRIILQLPELLYVQGSSGNNTLNDSISSNLLANDVQTEAFLHSPESSEAVSKCSRVLSEPSCSAESNAHLDVLSNVHFSSRLQEALNEKVPLSRVLRSELIDIICRSITVNSKYPPSITVTDAERKIVSDYPYLKECIGTGYGGWRQAIRDRLKNIRRFDDSYEVKCRRKIVKIAPEETAQKRKSDIKNDQNESQNKMLLNERQFDTCELNENFDIRRNEIVVEKIKVDILKSKYPGLFTKIELENEFYRVTGKSNLFQYIPKFLELYGEQLNNLLMARKKLPAWAQTIKCILDGSTMSIQTIEEIFRLITLPVHFSEDQVALTYPPTVTDNIKEATLASPHLGIIGLETGHPKFYVLVDCQIVLQTKTLSEAMAILLASYYIFNCEYPKQWNKTLLFTQNFIFDINAKNSKLPCKVVNFGQKLKNFSV